METHVSSTTADVPETQEVIGSHGNVELVIVVEKVEEDQQQKADSNTQDNAQPVMEENNPICNQPPKKDGLHKSPSKLDLLQESVSKDVNNKTTQPSVKTQSNKQPSVNIPNKTESPVSQNRLSDKQVGNLPQNTPTKEAATAVGVDSTSPRDVTLDETLKQVDNKDNIALDITMAREASNDSQIDMNFDASEKEHNKSISRELKSLIKSAKESKIISECTKLTSKTRKSRAALDTSNANLNNTPEADSIQGNRRSSSNSQKSNSSEKSDKVGKRSMRSQNPEFVHKVKQFLNSVTGKFQRGGDSDASSDEEIVAIKNKGNNTDCAPTTPKNRNPIPEQVSPKMDEKSNKLRSDPYCWRCHWSIDLTDGEKNPQPSLKCTVCPRAFHYRCLTGTERTKIISEKNWVCPECMTVLHAESSESRSPAMKKTSLGMLCELLKFALQRMMEVNGAEPFLQPVDRAVLPDYDKYVVHPMDLSLMRENISEGMYGSTESFLADAHWILHNSIIFNTLQSKLTTVARALVRSCRAEMGEIEACPECYAAAHARRPTWFTDVCSTPHLLLWAKLKGFPYWPAKAMQVSHAGLVDVRFFGAHDRAWVPARDCYLFCEKDPNNFRTKRQDLMDSMQEAEQHIRNISRKYGKFVYAPFRTTFEPARYEEQLKIMIPAFDGPVKSPIREKRPKTPALGKKSRSNSKGSKDDSNVGEVLSDSEPMDADVSKTSDDMDTNGGPPAAKTQTVSTRKRRHSEMNESAATGTDSSPKEKHVCLKRRLEGEAKKQVSKKTEALLVTSSKDVAPKPSEAKNESDELIEVVESDLPKPNPTRPTPNNLEAAAELNKLDAKANDAAAQLSKIPAETEPAKTNDKKKNVAQEQKTPQKTVIQNEKSLKSNKSSSNVETIELKEINSNTSPSHQTSKSPANSSAKTYTVINKNSSKGAVPVTKTNEKEKTPDSAVLIKITENINKNNKDRSTSTDTNVKENLTEPAIITKVTSVVKLTPNKNEGNEKETENITPNKTNAGGKITVTTTPRSAVKFTVQKDAGLATPSNKHSGSAKPTEEQVLNTGSNVQSADVTTRANNAVKEKAKQTIATDITPRSDSSADSTVGKKASADMDKSTSAKNTVTPKPGTSKVVKATKDRIQSDDDTNLAVVARKVPKGSSEAQVVPSVSGLRSVTAGPAASSASPASTAPTTRSSSSAKAKTNQVTVEVNPDSSIFTPTSTDNVRNMKDAVNKLQKLRGGPDPPANPPLGRVGVRAFARMTSPPEKQAKTNDVLVEIKSEPMDFEDADTQLEASTVLDSLRPRSSAPAVSGANLREVRINKVIAAPSAAKRATKPPDVRPRAKKTFPQPKKADDGRAELTNKNSMVYIPIQPPISQAPLRAALKAAVHTIGPSTSATARSSVLFSNTNVKGVSPMAPPLLPMGPPPPPQPLPPLTTTATVTVGSAAAPVLSAGAGLAGTILAAPGFPTVPTTVHTVPLITSVNGQWTFSLQPVMSVGGGETITSPTVNGMGERATATTTASSSPAASPASAFASAPAPAPAPVPALVPTGSPANAPAPPVNRTPDTPFGEPPRLQQRPVLQNPLAASTDVGELTAPSVAGPLTAKLNQNSIKLAEFFRNLLEDSLVQVEEPAAELAALRLQLEQARWRHQHELAELRHTHELLLVEARSVMEKEKARAVAEARRLAHQELEAAVKNAKSKQWCANCSQEAQFYCCWNTSYCDYPCQRAHWAQHYATCTQQRTPSVNNAEGRSEQTRPATPADVPKTTSAPNLTVATNKVTSVTTRAVNSEQTQNKSPIVVNVLEDGTPHASQAPPPAQAPLHASPLLSNKQLISNEECGTKRLVSSGGYLIVGAGAGAAVVAAPEQRRAPRRD